MLGMWLKISFTVLQIYFRDGYAASRFMSQTIHKIIDVSGSRNARMFWIFSVSENNL